MDLPRSFIVLFAACLLANNALGQSEKPSKVSIDKNLVLVCDGKKVFPIGFTLPPPPDGKTPDGKPAYQEIRSAGAWFFRTGPMGPQMDWDDNWFATEQRYMDAAAAAGMHCAPWLKEASAVKENDAKTEALLRKIINRFKDHPGLGVWKGEDEPQWGKRAIPPMVKAKQIIRELDPNHPIWIVEAPRGTTQQLAAYNVTKDISGIDIYPISYPPGVHSEKPNKELSMVGDFTRQIMEAADGKLPVWMTLQIAFSGVTKPGKTLRFPTFFEERFMTYEAIINGARGLVYFGPSLPTTLNPRDKQLGWNWTFWQRVMRPVLEEIGEFSPLQPALVAENSKLPIKCDAGKEIEFLVREVGNDIFLLACRAQGKTGEVTFSGLPSALAAKAEVMYESPRMVNVKDGSFKDWFAPFEVHVYKIQKQ
jgi:hypothetical protein